MIRPTVIIVRAAYVVAVLAGLPVGDALAKTPSVATPEPAPARRYTFEVLARDGQVLDGHKIVGYAPQRLETADFNGPVIDDRGRTAFLLAAADADVLYVDGRAIVWTGKPVGGSPVQSLFKPSMNAAGSLAYKARIADRDTIVVDGSVVLQSGDEIPVCGVVDTIGDPILNASGSYMAHVITRAGHECITVDRQAVAIALQTRIGNLVIGDLSTVGESLTADKDVVFTTTVEGPREYLCTLHTCTPARDMAIHRPRVNGAGQVIYSTVRLNAPGLGARTSLVRRDGTQADVALNSFSTYAINDAGHIFSSMYGELSDYRRPGRRRITPYAPQRGALYGTRAFFATYPEIRRVLHLGLEQLTMFQDVSLNNRDQVAFMVNWYEMDRRTLMTRMHFAVLRGSPAGLARLPAPPPCSPCERIAAQSATPAEKAESRRLCHALYGALGELRGYRQAFVSAPKGADLFPDMYYNVTQATLARLAAGDFRHPIETMDQMLAFYDAYRLNRQSWSKTGHAADPWWQSYYDLAAVVDRNIAAASADPHLTTAARNFFDATIWHVPGLRDEGVKAHVSYDLPRAIRAAFARRFHPALTEADLRIDFDRSDETIRIATAPASRDIAEAAAHLGPWGTHAVDLWRLWQGDSLRSTADDAIRLRHVAWNDAFDRARTLAPAPASDHASLERAGAAACR